jgi:hypothetical protein
MAHKIPFGLSNKILMELALYYPERFPNWIIMKDEGELRFTRSERSIKK